ncbi:hypothetical protein AQI88_08065 [Streptomyces cellostaticus]|uniref:Chaplin domain-containing protein n=1 Tax=Streptomyces cellostaticus TaxID=67285 RepID=A0A101NPU5_9ACTN|nr:hypothetical protein [Streptomyces cellostaticus]KUM97225.1 hypothetical protein AQI88_08065 [Streptomyces cellostaticus]GHI03988.1 hypothetical protein Scel_23090 [Streptomyces cellostaticus]
MKKISALAVLTVAGLALATPAHADNDGEFGGHIKTASHRNGLATDLCKGALLLVPVTAPWSGESVDNACNNRDHTDLARH